MEWPGNGDPFRLEAIGLQTLLDFCERGPPACEYGLIGGVVICDPYVVHAVQRAPGRFKRRGSREHSALDIAPVDGEGPGMRHSNCLFEGPYTGRDERGILAETVAGDDIWPQADVHQRRINNQVGEQDTHLRPPYV